MDEKRGRGRPKKDSSFSNTMRVRVSKNQEEMVDKLAVQGGKSRGEVLREALEKYYYLKIMGEMTYFD